jgi:hypothetical protein
MSPKTSVVIQQALCHGADALVEGGSAVILSGKGCRRRLIHPYRNLHDTFRVGFAP